MSDVDRAKSFYQSLGWRLDAELAGLELVVAYSSAAGRRVRSADGRVPGVVSRRWPDVALRTGGIRSREKAWQSGSGAPTPPAGDAPSLPARHREHRLRPPRTTAGQARDLCAALRPSIAFTAAGTVNSSFAPINENTHVVPPPGGRARPRRRLAQTNEAVQVRSGAGCSDGSDELRGGQGVRTGLEERFAVEGEETQVGNAADGRGAGNVVEERDLAEVIAWCEGAD